MNFISRDCPSKMQSPCSRSNTWDTFTIWYGAGTGDGGQSGLWASVGCWVKSSSQSYSVCLNIITHIGLTVAKSKLFFIYLKNMVHSLIHWHMLSGSQHSVHLLPILVCTRSLIHLAVTTGRHPSSLSHKSSAVYILFWNLGSKWMCHGVQMMSLRDVNISMSTAIFSILIFSYFNFWWVFSFCFHNSLLFTLHKE